VDPCTVCADVTVTGVQVLEIRVIVVGTVGIHEHNHPLRITAPETPGPLVRLPPEAIIGDARIHQGRGLREIDKAAMNRILARGGVVLKSKATASERQVVVHREDGRTVEHARFWMDKAPVPGVSYPDDEDEDGGASGDHPDPQHPAARLALPDGRPG
jgi:hypothetical protein